MEWLSILKENMLNLQLHVWSTCNALYLVLFGCSRKSRKAHVCVLIVHTYSAVRSNSNANSHYPSYIFCNPGAVTTEKTVTDYHHYFDL